MVDVQPWERKLTSQARCTAEFVRSHELAAASRLTKNVVVARASMPPPTHVDVPAMSNVAVELVPVRRTSGMLAVVDADRTVWNDPPETRTTPLRTNPDAIV